MSWVDQICQEYERGRMNGEDGVTADVRYGNPNMMDAYRNGYFIGAQIKRKNEKAVVIGALKDDSFQPSHPAYLPSIDG